MAHEAGHSAHKCARECPPHSRPKVRTGPRTVSTARLQVIAPSGLRCPLHDLQRIRHDGRRPRRRWVAAAWRGARRRGGQNSTRSSSKSLRHFGGSTALSGGGIWVPGARPRLCSRPDGVFEYLQTITDGLVSDARLRRCLDAAPTMMEFLEGRGTVWNYRLRRLLPGAARRSELGSTINVPTIDLRKLGDEEQNLFGHWRWRERNVVHARRP